MIYSYLFKINHLIIKNNKINLLMKKNKEDTLKKSHFNLIICDILLIINRNLL